MYIQLTTRCNMTCSHCCFAANARGDDMDGDVYLRALELAARHGDHITLGGGEPTLHKRFFDFLDKAIAYYNAGSLDIAPLVVTNGKLVTKARRLLDEYVEMDDPVWVDLSQDEWHDPIRPEVVRRFQAFQRMADARRYSYSGSNSVGGAGIRTVQRIMPVGRAAEATQGLLTEPDGCCCDPPLVDPLGNVFSCGCKTHLIGNIFEDDVLADFDWSLCHAGGGLPVREEARIQPLPRAA